MQINIDLDCTLNNLVNVWCETLNNIYGTNVLYEDITKYDIQEFFPSLNKEQVYNPLYLESFWSKTKPIEGSQEFLKKLYDDKHDIDIVTSTHYSNAKVKIKWIMEYFPFIHWKKINIVHDKKKFAGDYLIDDYIDNLIGFKGKRILYTQPWNKKYSSSELDMLNITRVNNWEEIYKIIPKPHPCGKNKKTFDFECLNCPFGYDDDGGIYCSHK